MLATMEGPINSVIADGAYDGASVYEAASIRQHDPPPNIVTPPRTSSVVNADDAGASTVRARHVRYIAEKGRMPWQKATGYSRRSLVETAVSRYKPIIGPNLRARSSDSQEGEVAIAIQILNRTIRIAKPTAVRFVWRDPWVGPAQLQAGPSNKAPLNAELFLQARGPSRHGYVGLD